MLEVLINIDGANIKDERLIEITDRAVAYRIALSILTMLSFTDKGTEELTPDGKIDDRPIWPGRR